MLCELCRATEAEAPRVSVRCPTRPLPQSPAAAPGCWSTCAAGPAPAPCSAPGDSCRARLPAAGLQERRRDKPQVLQLSWFGHPRWETAQAALWGFGSAGLNPAANSWKSLVCFISWQGLILIYQFIWIRSLQRTYYKINQNDKWKWQKLVKIGNIWGEFHPHKPSVYKSRNEKQKEVKALVHFCQTFWVCFVVSLAHVIFPRSP